MSDRRHDRIIPRNKPPAPSK